MPGYISEWLHCPKCSKNPSVSRITSRKKPRSSSWVTSSFSTTPSMPLKGATSRLAVCTVGPHEVIHLVISVDRLAGVAPETVEHVIFHESPLEIPVVDVRDL